MATQGCDQSADSAGGKDETAGGPAVWSGKSFWRESAKSREREGSALASRKPPSDFFSSVRRCGLSEPASGTALEHVTVMQQPVEHRADCGNVAEQLAPVFHRPIRRQQRTGAFITAHDDFEEILSGGLRQLPHPEVVNDQQSDRGD